MTDETASRKLRELLQAPGFFPSVGIWDPYSARVAEALGAPCGHLGGYQLGAALVISEPLISLTELASTTRYITSAIDIPLFVDAGAGYGEPLHCMHTVHEVEKAGAAGLHIEDQIYPKRVHYHMGIEHVVPREEFLARIKAAVDARRDPDFMIMARTDAMHVVSYAEGVERANLCLAAGADAVMIAPDRHDEAERAPKDIDGPVAYINSEGNKLRRPLFSIKEFGALGYKTATYPTALLCPVTQTIKKVMKCLMETGVSGNDPEEMIAQRKEVEDLIGLEEKYAIESATVEK
jgi:methylisocitrate lyase